MGTMSSNVSIAEMASAVPPSFSSHPLIPAKRHPMRFFTGTGDFIKGDFLFTEYLGHMNLAPKFETLAEAGTRAVANFGSTLRSMLTRAIDIAGPTLAHAKMAEPYETNLKIAATSLAASMLVYKTVDSIRQTWFGKH